MTVPKHWPRPPSFRDSAPLQELGESNPRLLVDPRTIGKYLLGLVDGIICMLDNQATIMRRLDTIQREERTEMADDTALKASVDAMAAGVTTANASLDHLASLITGQAGVIPQADLDAMQAELDTARQALAASVAKDDPAPVTPPAPTPTPAPGA